MSSNNQDQCREDLLGMPGCIIAAYDAGDNVRIERVVQSTGDALWAVRKHGQVLGKHGEWEWEPFPSQRTVEFFETFRFATPQEALGVLRKSAIPD